MMMTGLSSSHTPSHPHLRGSNVKKSDLHALYHAWHVPLHTVGFKPSPTCSREVGRVRLGADTAVINCQAVNVKSGWLKPSRAALPLA